MRSLSERFEGKYLRRAAVECWPWTGALNDGYGEIKAEKGNRKFKAHRVSFQLWKGPIPADKVIDHICRNRACVNPAHLRLLSRVENTMIGFGYYAVNGRKTHCAHGHEFTPENTLPHSGGGRRCRICKNAQSTASKRRKRSS